MLDNIKAAAAGALVFGAATVIETPVIQAQTMSSEQIQEAGFNSLAENFVTIARSEWQTRCAAQIKSGVEMTTKVAVEKQPDGGYKVSVQMLAFKKGKPGSGIIGTGSQTEVGFMVRPGLSADELATHQAFKAGATKVFTDKMIGITDGCK